MSMPMMVPSESLASFMVCMPGPQPMSRMRGCVRGGMSSNACCVYLSRPDPCRGMSLWISNKRSMSKSI